MDLTQRGAEWIVCVGCESGSLSALGGANRCAYHPLASVLRLIDITPVNARVEDSGDLAYYASEFRSSCRCSRDPDMESGRSDFWGSLECPEVRAVEAWLEE